MTVDDIIADLDEMVVEGGYTRKQLREVFHKVENKDNWKYPIQAVIEKDDLGIVTKAVEFFTGSKVEVVSTLTTGKIAVYASGYYETIGA